MICMSGQPRVLKASHLILVECFKFSFASYNHNALFHELDRDHSVEESVAEMSYERLKMQP